LKQKLLEPLYTEDDVNFCLQMFETRDFETPFDVTKNVKCVFTDNGHILGSAAVYLKINEEETITRLAFTGDIGRYSSPLLNDPKSFPQCDILICESTYGNRLHEKIEDSQKLLLEIVKQTCVEKKGKLIIPAFSLGRTQELVFTLNNLSLSGDLPKIKVYVDSPLSFNATNIIRKHIDLLNEKVKNVAKNDPDPFGFECLNYITEVDESKKLNDKDEPCIIISASGMAEAGRIRHHIKNNVSDPKNTILMVGYAEPHSLGGQLRNGNKEVRIYGEYYQVNAEVRVIDSYSAHADYQEMLRYLSCQDVSKIKRTFLVHGETDAIVAWKQHLQGNGFKNVTIGKSGDHYHFDSL
ncbi:MAG TPA: MBL fold metallo-hydrolase, partial [Flavobacteriales bacterium]|nr:MBL fold metallo-hydrolase [Flavobacteriales bacterium]